MPIENVYWGNFLAIAIFSFGLATLGAGLFTAYFGAGKSRAIGFTLSIVGVLVLLVFATLTWDLVAAIEPLFDSGSVAVGLVSILGGIVGGIVALILFLASIMKA